jgi:hypothetical protein
MPHWISLLGQKQSEQQLLALRSEIILKFNYIDKFTCDECPFKTTCEYVFDPYNTNGDCLAEK